MTTPASTTLSLLPAIASDPNLSPETRLWIFLGERRLTESETAAAQRALDAFSRHWTAHNQALKARAEVFQNQIVLLAVDESQAGASGCSIDKSVHFLESLGAELGVDFLDKMRFAWLHDEQWQVAGRSEFARRLAEGAIHANTLVANTLVATKADLNEKWAVPLGQSWHKRLFL